MSYISAIRNNNDVLVWERTKQGRIMTSHKAPYYYYKRNPDGPYTSMFGDKLERYDYDTSVEFNKAKAQEFSNGHELFESDIPPELKYLSKHYYNVPAPKLHISFLDIEVDYDLDRGFSSVDDPYAPLNSVAIYHNWSNRMIVLAVPPPEYDGPTDEYSILELMNQRSKLPDDSKIEVTICKDEKELLILLLEELHDSDVISGWNSDFFDVPYIGKRLLMLSKNLFNKLSFQLAGSPKWRTVEVFGREQETLDLCGRGSLDYMVLFKKYEMAERPSYKLESIADEILPELPKLEYEGTLATLYTKDFIWFMRYNLRDTEILKGFEERLGYIELANQMYHLSTGLFAHVMGTLKLAELATINYCHHELDDLIVKDNDIQEEGGQIQGAFVLAPQVGLHENISSVDIASLYPSAIRSINISPETIMGQLVALNHEPLTEDLIEKVIQDKKSKKNKEDSIEDATELKKSKEVYAADLIAIGSDIEVIFTMEDGRSAKAPAKQLRQAFKENGWAVSGYGTVFNQNEHGIIPMILADWYAMRKKFKKQMAEAKDSGDKLKAVYFDKLQYVYKIKLNSFYGALTNRYFRFYDLRMGESTTGTGRKILMHQCAEACKHLDGKYQEPDDINHEYRSVGGEQTLRWHYGYHKDRDHSVVYGDTDSTYFLTHAANSDEATIIGDGIGELVNASFQEFMQRTFLCTEGYDDIIQCEREVVSDRGIFVDKKRYILHLVDLDGWKCDKIKVMGLDTKKTTLPKEVSNTLNGFVERFLKGETWQSIASDIVDFKSEVETTTDVMSIGLPKGIKGVENYTELYEENGNNQRLPGHVAASIFYNICRKQFKDNESMEIMSGMKIKVFYLNKKYGKFKSIAIPVDIETVPQWFLDNFTISRKDHVERLVDKPLGNIIKAIGEDVPSKQSIFVDSMLVY